jgi:hypothetical protein
LHVLIDETSLWLSIPNGAIKNPAASKLDSERGV